MQRRTFELFQVSIDSFTIKITTTILQPIINSGSLEKLLEWLFIMENY